MPVFDYPWSLLFFCRNALIHAVMLQPASLPVLPNAVQVPVVLRIVSSGPTVPRVGCQAVHVTLQSTALVTHQNAPRMIMCLMAPHVTAILAIATMEAAQVMMLNVRITLQLVSMRPRDG